MKNLFHGLFFILIFFCSTSFANQEQQLWDACYEENTADIKKLIEGGTVDINHQNDFGKTPLFVAILKENSEMLDMMLNCKNIKVDIKDNINRTPFMWACHYGCEDSASKLIRFVKDINEKDAYGDSALMILVNWAYDEEGFKEIFTLLLEHKANPNVKDAKQTPLLVLLTRRQSPDLVAKLLQCPNIDINAIDANNKTALMYAEETFQQSGNSKNKDLIEKYLEAKDAAKI